MVDAFGDVRQLREYHAREIKPLLADAAMRPRVMAEAKRIAALQASARERGEGLDGPKVIAALKRASAGERKDKAKSRTGPSLITNEAGATLFTLMPKGSRKVVLELALSAKATNEDFHTAFQRELDRLRPSA